jgi:hypothetical protein
MTTRTSSHGHLMPVVRVIASFSFSVALLTAQGLTITSVTPPGTVAPGQTLTITVTPTGTFTQVAVVGEGPIGYSSILPVTSSTATPYQISLPIPAAISPGVYNLTALGVSSSAKATSPAVTIDVERTDPPVEIDVTPASLYLPVGQRVPLRVVGTYADGTRLDITHSAGTAFSSMSPGVAKVDSQGYVTALQPSPLVFGQLQVARIAINNSISVPVYTPPALSLAPQNPNLYASQTTQFAAFEPGMAAVQVKWSISPQIGSIDNSGLYTAPKKIDPNGQYVVVTATLRDNPSASITTGVNLFPPVTISINPPPASGLHALQTWQFYQDINNAMDDNVDWSISPKVGTIDNTGLYTAPATIAKQQTIVVTATSIADSTKTASAKFSLLPD